MVTQLNWQKLVVNEKQKAPFNYHKKFTSLKNDVNLNISCERLDKMT